MEKSVARVSFEDLDGDYGESSASEAERDGGAEVYSDGEEEAEMSGDETRRMVAQQNRKGRKSGGFQSMGLSRPVFTGVMRKGYRVPTPIQRKCIPLILDGKDIVAMARTGSGKTAAFLVPMFERLKAHSVKIGARALVLSPTRELATQTMKFTKELGCFTDLRSTLVLGGDKMDDQFLALHRNPDIIIATPGRFLHLVVEMELQLSSIEYVVFDEADRLFEMGFAEQLQEIIRRLPDSRQTLLLSATLPKLLIDFAKAGLKDPVLVRLDVDSKLSDQLRLCFLSSRQDDKPALLLYLLQHVLPPDEQTVVFAATKHHVEYLRELLHEAGIEATYIYSSLDQTARKINVAKFVSKKVMMMIVTDVAARGIDIPLLDNVINYNFPSKSKLFIHRVGRVARAGRSGAAYCLVSGDEVAYLLDLHLFLGRTLQLHRVKSAAVCDGEHWPSGVYGSVPQVVVDQVDDIVQKLHDHSSELDSLKQVADNAQKQYVRSRGQPSPESVKRAKQLPQNIPMHPVFQSLCSEHELQATNLLDSLKLYKPTQTILEIHSTTKSVGKQVMKRKREYHSGVVALKRERQSELKEGELSSVTEAEQEQSSFDDLAGFQTELSAKTAASRKSKKFKRRRGRDEEHYLHYTPSDAHSELGLSVASSFEQQAAGAVLELDGDEENSQRKMKNVKRWDRKRKKFVGDSGQEQKQKKIKTESGHYINASYKSSAYHDWRDKHKIDTPLTGQETEGAADGVAMATGSGMSKFKRSRFRSGAPGSAGKKMGKGRSHGGVGGLKTKAEILKKRNVKQVQERRRKMKRKAAAMKGQSTNRRKGHAR